MVSIPKVHPSSFVHKTAVIIGDVTIGKNCGVFPHAVIRGDANSIVIGDGSNIQDGCVIHVDADNSCFIGSGVSIGHLAMIHGASIEDDCIIGMHSTIMNKATIGKGCIIGAGTVVTQGTTIPPNSLVLGVPGKVLKKEQNFLSIIRENAEVYVRLSQDHKDGKFEEYNR